jgi:putative transposase
MGVRTFATLYGNKGIKELHFSEETLDNLNKKLDRIRKKRSRPLQKNKRLRCRRRNINRLERRKENIIDELHWKTIHCILNENNLIFYGDFKSHGIVKDGKNRHLNRRINDLKFHKFKTRLIEKCEERNRMFFLVQENHTTKTCSICGTLNDPRRSKVYNCSSCKVKLGRDQNAAKNILMKGIMSCI